MRDEQVEETSTAGSVFAYGEPPKWFSVFLSLLLQNLKQQGTLRKRKQQTHIFGGNPPHFRWFSFWSSFKATNKDGYQLQNSNKDNKSTGVPFGFSFRTTKTTGCRSEERRRRANHTPNTGVPFVFFFETTIKQRGAEPRRSTCCEVLVFVFQALALNIATLDIHGILAA